jgi:hypothetical protein
MEIVDGISTSNVSLRPMKVWVIRPNVWVTINKVWNTLKFLLWRCLRCLRSQFVVTVDTFGRPPLPLGLGYVTHFSHPKFITFYKIVE